MSDFEREIVNCLNRFFKTNHIPGFAYRLRQHSSIGRCMGVLADSPDPSGNLAIECKSIVDRKLYFSQHFHSTRTDPSPVDAISDFLIRTGRTGFLAVEFRGSRGEASEAFLIPWPVVARYFRDNRGISIDDARSCIVLAASKEGYLLESLNAK